MKGKRKLPKILKPDSEQNLKSLSSVSAKLGEVETVRPKRCIWRTIDITDGLPGSVLCIHQDQRGYIWFGTPDGLCRYDGTEFLTYTTEHGLAVNLENLGVDFGEIRIHEDSRGRLWVYRPRVPTNLCKRFVDSPTYSSVNFSIRSLVTSSSLSLAASRTSSAFIPITSLIANWRASGFFILLTAAICSEGSCAATANRSN